MPLVERGVARVMRRDSYGREASPSRGLAKLRRLPRIYSNRGPRCARYRSEAEGQAQIPQFEARPEWLRGGWAVSTVVGHVE